MKDELGRYPHTEKIRDWGFQHSWYERADTIRAEASKQMQIVLVDETVEMWKQHANAAKEIAIKALEHIREHGFDSSASAVQAIKWAQEEERKTRGAEAFITKLKNTSSADLMETIRELMERSTSTEDVADGEIKE